MKLTYDGRCGKVHYSSKAEAKRAAKRGTRQGHRLRIYHCPECQVWHLTRVANPNNRRFGCRVPEGR